MSENQSNRFGCGEKFYCIVLETIGEIFYSFIRDGIRFKNQFSQSLYDMMYMRTNGYRILLYSVVMHHLNISFLHFQSNS